MEIGMINILNDIIGHCTDQRNLLQQMSFLCCFQLRAVSSTCNCCFCLLITMGKVNFEKALKCRISLNYIYPILFDFSDGGELFKNR